MALLVNRDRLVQLVSLVILDLLVHPVQLDLQDPQDPSVHLAFLETLAQLVPLAQEVPLEQQDPQVHLVQQDLLDQPDLLVLQEVLATQALMGQLVQQVQVDL